jgi:predicted O-methyltransferase YrrM
MDKVIGVDIDFIEPTADETAVLNQLDPSYLSIALMQHDQMEFLNSLILRNKPKKLLEVGVAAGGSSIVMLNAIKDFPEAKLFSVDLNDKCCTHPDKSAGFFVDFYPYLKPKWELFLGGLALNFLEEVSTGIDFCFMDSSHMVPGEILDVLMVLPFLADDAILVFHDVSLTVGHCIRKNYLFGESAISNTLLMSAITGRKMLPVNHKGSLFPDIAGIRVSKDLKENVFEILNLLLLRWSYFFTESQELEIMSWFEKYYDRYFVGYLKKVFLYQKVVILGDKRYGRSPGLNYMVDKISLG